MTDLAVRMMFCLTAMVSLSMPSEAHADVWRITLQDAKREAHYLINTQNATVTSMRGQQCVRSFTARLEGEKTDAPRVIVDSELSGGGSAAGTRGSQRMEFVLRAGNTQVTTSSTLRGTRPPIPAAAVMQCRGAACSMPSC
jgi:hypothetical protein